MEFLYIGFYYFPILSDLIKGSNTSQLGELACGTHTYGLVDLGLRGEERSFLMCVCRLVQVREFLVVCLEILTGIRLSKGGVT